jgi:hypothetical protein
VAGRKQGPRSAQAGTANLAASRHGIIMLARARAASLEFAAHHCSLQPSQSVQ